MLRLREHWMECGLSGFLAYTPLITRQADFCTSQTTSDSQVIIQFVFLLPCCPSLPSTIEPQEGSTQMVQPRAQSELMFVEGSPWVWSSLWGWVHFPTVTQLAAGS